MKSRYHYSESDKKLFFVKKHNDYFEFYDEDLKYVYTRYHHITLFRSKEEAMIDGYNNRKNIITHTIKSLNQQLKESLSNEDIKQYYKKINGLEQNLEKLNNKINIKELKNKFQEYFI